MPTVVQSGNLKNSEILHLGTMTVTKYPQMAAKIGPSRHDASQKEGELSQDAGAGYPTKGGERDAGDQHDALEFHCTFRPPHE